MYDTEWCRVLPTFQLYRAYQACGSSLVKVGHLDRQHANYAVSRAHNHLVVNITCSHSTTHRNANIPYPHANVNAERVAREMEVPGLVPFR